MRTVQSAAERAWHAARPQDQPGWVLAQHVPFTVVLDLLSAQAATGRAAREAAEAEAYVDVEEELGGSVGSRRWGVGRAWPAGGAEEEAEWEAEGSGRAWVLKPSLARGGAEVSVVGVGGEEGVREVQRRVAAYPDAAQWVLQRYVERPLLVHGKRKFHARIYVVCVDALRVGVYREGLVLVAPRRFDASRAFASPEACADSSVHITNTCFARERLGDRRFEASGLIHLFSSLDALVGRPVAETAWRGIRATVAALFASLRGNVGRYTPAGLGSFELYGLDFLLSDSGHPWLLEVNAGPDLRQTGHALLPFMHKLARDLCELVLDPPARTHPSPPAKITPWGLREDLWTPRAVAAYLAATRTPLAAAQLRDAPFPPRFALPSNGSASAFAAVNGWDMVWDEVWTAALAGGTTLHE